MNVGDGTQKDNNHGMSDLTRRLGPNVKVKEKYGLVEVCRKRCNDYLRGPEWQFTKNNPSGFPVEAFNLVEALTRARLDVHWTVLEETDPTDDFITMKLIKSVCWCSQQRIPVVRSIIEGTYQHYACTCGMHGIPVDQELREAKWMTVLNNICNTFENQCTAILTNAISDATAAQADDSPSANADRYSVSGPHQ